MTHTLTMLAGIILACLASLSSAGNPVIGILTQSSPSYIAASYVKYLESAGARVVPVFHTSTESELKSLFSKLNGILIPGGGADLSDFSKPFLSTANYTMSLALEANDKGDYFPVWGTCLGFETLAVVVAQDPVVLTGGYLSENLPLPLQLTAAAKTSRMFAKLSEEIYQAMQTENLTMNYHQQGVPSTTVTSNDKLDNFFTILSTNVDQAGKEFVSTFEGKHYPVYGTQWHPEKNTYEFGQGQNTLHTSHAIELTFDMAHFFVDQARQSQHVYSEEELSKDIIWNYTPIYTGPQGSHFEQVYYFDN
eukprot:TRINITY_DN5784_c0_g1_i2.p1 TRINITY_DN5784_c0_g1~~TRINITY_DN5784_c0_g1_i2.p1  ORF type:complete len:307 (+),score=84.73 TRINITY_DN5784_c0_g1_i2:1-921(+)